MNVGLPEIDEPSISEEVVRELQSIIDLPLPVGYDGSGGYGAGHACIQRKTAYQLR